ESLLELGRPADAVQALTLALAQAPQYARAKRALIRAHRALDQHDRAAELEAELIAAGERLGNTSPGR
ncbi:MAG: tetratricopeptide repeat protein, partial [Planctomycetota bacterium]